VSLQSLLVGGHLRFGLGKNEKETSPARHDCDDAQQKQQVIRITEKVTKREECNGVASEKDGSGTAKGIRNAIDATLSFDKEGKPWLAFTTHRMGIKLVQIEDDLKTTAVSPEGRELYTIAERHHLPDLNERNTADTSVAEVSYEELHPDSILGQNQQSENCAVEAPFIFRKDDYFYLFATWGRCRLDKEYTYEVVVGRSESITGPYLDNAGQRMDRGGGSVLVNGNEEYSAVAYNSIYTFDGSDYLVAHAYDISDEERTKLVILEMTWDENGWPVVELNRR
jgi:arabinan endo-1,5-alpha-L-arabinosidase